MKQGVKGLFQGIVPRVMLGIWQTLFMVTGECSFAQPAAQVVAA